MIMDVYMWDMAHNISCKQRRRMYVELLLSCTRTPKFLSQRKDTTKVSRQRFLSGRLTCENVYAYENVYQVQNAYGR